MTMQKEFQKDVIFDQATYTKSLDWSYEKEWRITSFKRKTDIGLFTDYKFHPQELTGIYFGPKISAFERASLVIAATKYPAIQLWNVSIGMGREFAFDKTAD